MRHLLIASICFQNDPCIVFIKTNPLELVGKWSPPPDSYGYDSVNGICTFSDGTLLITKKIKIADENIPAFDLAVAKIDDSLNINLLGTTDKVIGYDVHDMCSAKESGGIYKCFLQSTAMDQVFSVSLDTTKNICNMRCILNLQDAIISDVHHFNSFSICGDHLYITAAHKDNARGKLSDIIKMNMVSGTWEWMDISYSNGRKYMMAHNYTPFNDGHIICDSMRSNVVIFNNGVYKSKKLGGWTRGLCLLDNDLFVVGSSPRRGTVMKGVNGMLNHANIYMMDSDLNVLDSLSLPVTKGNIFSLKKVLDF